VIKRWQRVIAGAAALGAAIIPTGHAEQPGAGSVITANPHIYRQSFDPVVDLVRLALVAEGPLVSVVPGQAAALDPALSLADLRRSPASLYGSAGIGSQTDLIAERFLTATNLSASRFAEVGMQAGGAAPMALSERIRRENALWGDIIRARKITVDDEPRLLS
jgi:tripartite-type tricarboxylate transporter receptor subunit TctC